MLKKRIVGVVVVRNGIVVQSIGYRRYLPVGRPPVALEYLNRWGIDEILLIDISATAADRGPDYTAVREASARCRVPLTVGGGIRSVAQIHELMGCGADKVAVNWAARNLPPLVTEAAAVFGSQCVVASVDAILTPGGHRVYDHVSRATTSSTPAEAVVRLQELGAGEIFINSVDRDGTYAGYDVPLIESVCAVASVPVIACGGARTGHDMATLLCTTPVSAAAAANFFHFTEHSVILAKAAVAAGMPLRVETHAIYTPDRFAADMRLLRRDDATLEAMLYERDEPEVL